ncbi:MAG: hypothetical protein R2822_21345 [Spirosomataceae bacterium]
MYGNAVALAQMAALIGNDTLHSKYQQKAVLLRQLTHNNLWDESATFLK